MTIRIENAYILTMNDRDEIIENGCVLIQDDKILFTGQSADAPQTKVDRTIDAHGNIIMPGFVNAHTHLPMTIFKGYGEGLPLDRWLNEKIWPAEDRLTSEIMFWSSMLGLIEMVKSGTTAFLDMYMGYDGFAEAVKASRMRATFTRAIVDLGDGCGDRLEDSEALYRKYHGAGNLSVMMSLHGEYTCTENTARKLVDMARELKTGIHVHVSETRAEHEGAIARQGLTPMGFLDKIGATDVPLAAAHCVHVSKSDMALMAEKGVSVLSCPQSNLKLGSGIAPVAEMMAAGVNVAVGTDGSSSNNNLDMIEETMLIGLLQRGITQNAGAVSDMQALKMATCGGAKALGKASEIGQIKAGFLADIIMIDTSGIAFTPANDWVSCILNSGSGRDVAMTMIGGEIVYENGKVTFADETETKERVEKFAREICL